MSISTRAPVCVRGVHGDDVTLVLTENYPSWDPWHIASRRGRQISHFCHKQRAAVGSTQPPSQWVQAFFPVTKAAVAWSWPLTYLVPRLRMSGILPPLPYTFMTWTDTLYFITYVLLWWLVASVDGVYLEGLEKTTNSVPVWKWSQRFEAKFSGLDAKSVPAARTRIFSYWGVRNLSASVLVRGLLIPRCESDTVSGRELARQ
jgi:hypothetical protein